MKILVIGDAFSQYTIAFSRFLKQYDPAVVIDIINTRLAKSDIELADPNVYDEIYESAFINTVIQYDIICLQGFWEVVLSIYNRLVTKDIFTVGMIWGSDFYRRDHSARSLSGILDRCDRVLIPTDEMAEDVLKVYSLPLGKIRKCMFGLEPLETLMTMKNISSAKAKRRLGLRADSFAITCGHNASPFQNHPVIIDHLIQIIPKLPANYVLIFPFTYGGNESYISSVKDKLKKSSLNYHIIEDYMSDEEVSLLRLATNIFIHVQPTDAFSGAMREHLFSKNIVVTGSWLPYQALVQNNIYFETINGLQFLGRKIAEILDNYPEGKRKAELYNTPEKFEQYRWPEVIQNWHQIFLEYKIEKI
jgi:hypothetical protein